MQRRQILDVYEINPEDIQDDAPGTRLAWIVDKFEREPKAVVYVRGSQFAEDDFTKCQSEEQKGEVECSLTRPVYSNHRVELKRSASARQDETSKRARIRIDPTTSSEEHMDIFMPIPLAESFRIAVFGSTGTGKSKWTADNTVTSYLLLYPQNDVYVWSFFASDPAYEKLDGVKFIHVTADILSNPPLADHFSNALMIFDDIEALPKDVREIMVKFRDQCLACGRKLKISTVTIAHEIHAGHLSKAPITECDEIVLFSQGNGNVKPIKVLLMDKFGLSAEDTQEVLDSPTRWVLVKKSYPKIMMSPRMIRCL